MSTQAQALALLDAAAGETPAIPWGLIWPDVIQRLRTLVISPELLHQRALNACGPAVFFRIWFARDPLGAATAQPPQIAAGEPAHGLCALGRDLLVDQLQQPVFWSARALLLRETH